ncbi:MAG: hypothetical protein ACYTAN_08075, partial [Planctomycetota bacterium]
MVHIDLADRTGIEDTDTCQVIHAMGKKVRREGVVPLVAEEGAVNGADDRGLVKGEGEDEELGPALQTHAFGLEGNGRLVKARRRPRRHVHREEIPPRAAGGNIPENV